MFKQSYFIFVKLLAHVIFLVSACSKISFSMKASAAERWRTSITPIHGNFTTCDNLLDFYNIGNGSVSCVSDKPILMDGGIRFDVRFQKIRRVSIFSQRVICNWTTTHASNKTLKIFESILRISPFMIKDVNSKIGVTCKNADKKIGISAELSSTQPDLYDISVFSTLRIDSRQRVIFDAWPNISNTFDPGCKPVTLAWNRTRKNFTCNYNNTISIAKFLPCIDLQNCRLYAKSNLFNGTCNAIYKPQDCITNESECYTRYLSNYRSSGILYCQAQNSVVRVPLFKFGDIFSLPSGASWVEDPEAVHGFYNDDNDQLKRFVKLELDSSNILNLNTMQFKCFAPKFLAIAGFTWTLVFENDSIPICITDFERSTNSNLLAESCITRRPNACRHPCTFQIICSVYFQNGKEYSATLNGCNYATKNCSNSGFSTNSPINYNPNMMTEVSSTELIDNSISTDNNQTSAQPRKIWEYILAGGMAGAIITLGLLYLHYYRKSKESTSRNLLSSEDIRNFLGGVVPMNNLIQVKDQQGACTMVVPYDRKLEIPRREIKFEEKVLGKGYFGQVVLGSVGGRSVAIKMIDKSVDANYFRAILSELKIMSFVGKHDNIVALIGANTEKIRKQDVYVILEFCSNGNALDYVRARRAVFLDLISESANNTSRNLEITQENTIAYENFISTRLSSIDLIRWSMEIAAGMDFIASKNVCHGDLAARNILLSNHLVAKIGDFGLAKQLSDYALYIQKEECPLPLKWMSIESLRDLEFSIQSDVWSFGVTVWELFSLGSTPYPGIHWNFQAWKLLLEGQRMDQASHSSSAIHDILLKCWETEPNDRPRFADLQGMFAAELNKVHLKRPQ